MDSDQQAKLEKRNLKINALLSPTEIGLFRIGLFFWRSMSHALGATTIAMYIWLVLSSGIFEIAILSGALFIVIFLLNFNLAVSSELAKVIGHTSLEEISKDANNE